MHIQKTVSGWLPSSLLMFVLSLAFVDPYNNESQFGDLTGYDELSKQAIVLLIPELVSCGDGKETEILPGARRQTIKKI